MRQGLVNPNDAVPYLFALQGDVDNAEIKSLARDMLIAEGEKRPDTLRLRICAGVRQAFDFQISIRGAGQASALSGKANESIFDDVFRECVSKNKKQRRGLFRNLVNLFDLKDFYLDELPRKTRKDAKVTPELPLLGFAAEILAYLPYTTTTDPLFISKYY